jgi:hypothetical protein
MIYLPGRAVFIHIPRTGGNSVKNAIASNCIGYGIQTCVSTVPYVYKEFERVQGHQRATVLKGYIREWNDIYRFAIHRPMQERIESIFSWVEKLRNRGYCEKPGTHPEVRELICRDDYKEWIRENWQKHTTQWFTQGDYGEDLGVEIYKFEDLSDRWGEICDKCNIPKCELPHLNKS